MEVRTNFSVDLHPPGVLLSLLPRLWTAVTVASEQALCLAVNRAPTPPQFVVVRRIPAVVDVEKEQQERNALQLPAVGSHPLLLLLPLFLLLFSLFVKLSPRHCTAVAGECGELVVELVLESLARRRGAQCAPLETGEELLHLCHFVLPPRSIEGLQLQPALLPLAVELIISCWHAEIPEERFRLLVALHRPRLRRLLVDAMLQAQLHRLVGTHLDAVLNALLNHVLRHPADDHSCDVGAGEEGPDGDEGEDGLHARLDGRLADLRLHVLVHGIDDCLLPPLLVLPISLAPLFH
mmetsp:Transcript_22428/g.88804  ORF Transcript_22428/g.88804 Transcript_22428/m.88804 type:complete len:294 (-) Transcript_22428:737-1618(-)